MALNPGDLSIIAVFTDADTGGSGAEALIRILATTDIPAGEVVRIYEAGLTNADYIEYTVGSDGLDPLDIVTFTESGDAVTIEGDPTGSASVVQSDGTPGDGTDFAPFGENDLSIVSDGSVIWAIDFDNPFETNNASTTLAEDHNATADPIVIIENPAANGAINADGNGGFEDNWIFTGSTLEELDDPTKYTWIDGDVVFDNPGLLAPGFDNQANITCFAPGTSIATPSGTCAVEKLQVGDLVCTLDGLHAAVRWVGKQTVNTLFRPNDNLGLVRITAGALGGGLPYSDLTLTADHAVFLDGLLVNAGTLVNGSSIRLLTREETGLTYVVYHIETENHEVILANGAPSETFIDVAGRRAFDNYQEYLDLYGHERIIPENPLPRITTARLIPQPIKTRLVA